VLFHDRKTNSHVEIAHEDVLPTASAVAAYTHLAGAHGELDIPAATGTGETPAVGRAYREEKGISLPHHMGALAAHEELVARAADAGKASRIDSATTDYYNKQAK
jgi:hypothetical protein